MAGQEPPPSPSQESSTPPIEQKMPAAPALPPPSSNDDPLALLKQEKLKLEIKNLKLKNSPFGYYSSLFARFGLFLTALAALSGIAYTTHKDREDREQAFALRLEARANEDINQILLSSTDSKGENDARITFLF